MDGFALLQKRNYIIKTIERLYGIIQGISIDYLLTDDEIKQLMDWLEIHQGLMFIEPFKGLGDLLSRCIEDGVIDDQEREEILDWCGMFINSDPYPFGITNAVRRLHGVLSGIQIDNSITDVEITELRDWLYSYEKYSADTFPFNELIPMIDRILSDGRIDDDERLEISEFCKHFTERVIKDPVFHDEIYIESWMETGAPIFHPILKFCDFNHKILFHNNRFCFTGPAKYGKRSLLCEIVERCGGMIQNNIVLHLDYLVIGAQASPYWVYSTYGRKIEGVIHNNKLKRSNTIIIHEDDFIRQANEFIESIS